MVLLIEAGQMTASNYGPIDPDLPLASEEASTDAIRDHAGERQVSVETDDRGSAAIVPGMNNPRPVAECQLVGTLTVNTDIH